LNKIQSDVNCWIKEIRKITEFEYDISRGTAFQEINLWLNMETALEGIDKKLKSDEIGIYIYIFSF